MLEEQAEANNIMVDTLSPHRSKGEYLINKVANLTINNEVGNNLIDEVVNLTINDKVGKYLIDKVTNVTINDVVNNLNRSNEIDIQVQFAGDIAGISYQKLLSSWRIGIKHEEVPVLYPPM